MEARPYSYSYLHVFIFGQSDLAGYKLIVYDKIRSWKARTYNKIDLFSNLFLTHAVVFAFNCALCILNCALFFYPHCAPLGHAVIFAFNCALCILNCALFYLPTLRPAGVRHRFCFYLYIVHFELCIVFLPTLRPAGTLLLFCFYL